MMGSETYKPRFDTLNAAYFAPAASSSSKAPSSPKRLDTFHKFPCLPAELRLRILEMEHPQKRRQLITVTLKDDYRFKCKATRESLESSLYQNLNHLGNPVSGIKYRMLLHQRAYFSPLLRVNRESRQATLRHYRLHIPLRAGTGKRSGPLLYLNPECDILYLQAFKVCGSTLVGFLHDLRAYDERNIGLRNLALNSHFQENLGLLRSIKPGNLQRVEVASFLETLINLRQLWFVYLLEDANRKRTRSSYMTGDVETGINHSVPIFSESSMFEFFSTDPRSVQTDLKTIKFSGADPRLPMHRWMKMERRFCGFSDDSYNFSTLQREVSFILAVDATEEHEVCMTKGHDICQARVIRDTKSMDRYLERERESLLRLVKREEQSQGKASAAGFWVLPQDVFDVEMVGRPNGGFTCDLSSHSPALGLFRL